MTPADWDAMVTVGRIVRPQGRRGEVVVEASTDFEDERFQPGATLWVRRAGAVTTIDVETSWRHQGRWVLKLAGVGSIGEAEAWRDVELKVPADRLHPLADGSYYVHDLVGCRVETIEGVEVGEVSGVDFGSGTPVLVVMGGDREVLVPLAEVICRRIDVGAKSIVIDPPAGLIELNDPDRPFRGES